MIFFNMYGLWRLLCDFEINWWW